MALAPVVYTLWQNHLRFDPENPIWPNRDRFILSAGHASMLLYAMLHLTGTKAVNGDYETVGELSVKLDDIKRFRQLGSKCPGHPEYRLTSGIETTTGPLGQGVANSVGMALSCRWLANHFNRADVELFGFNVYALCSDGDLMEGVAAEAASVAGHLRLSNLCWIYDDNHITIDGPTSLTFSEDVAARFKAYDWNVTHVADANNIVMIEEALGNFKRCEDRPTLIVVHSHIGYGSPHKHDTSAAHGEPLGEEEVRLTKRFYGWPESAKFYVPEEVREHFRVGVGKRGRDLQEAWNEKFSRYQKQAPDLASQLIQMQRRELPEGWDRDLPGFPADPKGLPTRESAGKALNAIARSVPWLLGGSADLGDSTKVTLKFDGAGEFEPSHFRGRNLHFGVREHSMGAILNGMALSKIRPFGSTYLVFSDYERPPIRLAALMEVPSIFVFTHDSIGLGEDGPTHQPIGELASLRSIPGLVTLRPADANEAVEAWKVIMMLRHEPSALVLSRQAIPTIDRARYASASGVRFGAYVLADSDGTPDVLLMGTGSEVSLCLGAYEELKREGIKARVVSMPSWDIFEKQTPEYREHVLPERVTSRVSVEAASVFGWARYVGSSGISLGMKTFGASAPLKELLTHFGFTKEAVIAAARKQIERKK
jgi:transketolase